MIRIYKSFISLFLVISFLLAHIEFANAQCTQSCRPCAPCNPCPQCCTPCEPPSRIEHLPTYKGSSINMVKIACDSTVIVANNVIKATFLSDFNSKKICPNDRISFIINEGLTTCEGRTLLPCGTQVIGRIQQVEDPQWMNRNAKVYIIFEELVLPNCARIPMCGRVYDKDCVLKASSWKAVGKAAAYTVGLFGIGTGLGAAIGAASKAAGRGALVFGMPIGGGVGLLTGVLTPGLNFKAKEGDPVYIQLVQDLIICYH